jgi:translation initiation factor 1
MDLSNLFNGRDLKEDNYSSKPKKSKKDKTTTIKDEYLNHNRGLLTQEKHSLFFRIEKRRGKIITMVGYFMIDEVEKRSLLSTLKKKLSCGGAIKGDFLEFQGNFSEKLKMELIKIGFAFKK